MHYIAIALTNMAKEEEMERHHRAEEEFWKDRIGVEKERLQLRSTLDAVEIAKLEQYIKHLQHEDANAKVRLQLEKERVQNKGNTGSNTSQSSSTIRPFPQ